MMMMIMETIVVIIIIMIKYDYVEQQGRVVNTSYNAKTAGMPWVLTSQDIL